MGCVLSYLQREGGLRTQRGRRAECGKRWFYLCSRGAESSAFDSIAENRSFRGDCNFEILAMSRAGSGAAGMELQSLDCPQPGPPNAAADGETHPRLPVHNPKPEKASDQSHRPKSPELARDCNLSVRPKVRSLHPDLSSAAHAPRPRCCDG